MMLRLLGVESVARRDDREVVPHKTLEQDHIGCQAMLHTSCCQPPVSA